MSKPKKTKANFTQGQAVAERETGAGWGGPATSAAAMPLDQHHTRRSYVGFGELTPDTRRQPALAGGELARLVVNVSPAQIVHTGTIQLRRGMPGKVDASDGSPRTSGRIKAIHRFGSGPPVQRPADLGRDPLDRYVGARALLPPSSPDRRVARDHEQSAFWTAGDDITAAFSRGQ